MNIDTERPTKASLRQKKWAKRNKDKARFMQIKHNYGLSSESYLFLLGEQNGLCSICGMINENGMALSVDHIHVENYDKLEKDERSLLVRGLLCTACNLFVGHCGDNVENIKRRANKIANNIDSYMSKKGLV